MNGKFQSALCLVGILPSHVWHLIHTRQFSLFGISPVGIQAQTHTGEITVHCIVIIIYVQVMVSTSVTIWFTVYMVSVTDVDLVTVVATSPAHLDQTFWGHVSCRNLQDGAD